MEKHLVQLMILLPLKVNGVKQVVKLKNSVAVVATSTWAAKKGREALVIQWEAKEKLENSAEHFVAFKEMIDKGYQPIQNRWRLGSSQTKSHQVLRCDL